MSQQTKKPTKSLLEQTLADALETTRNLQLQSHRADAVRLAIQTLLLIRGGLDPKLFKGEKTFNPYPVLVKYIRASNAETLGGLADNVLRSVSPNFITLHSLGDLAEAIYSPSEELDQQTLQLLQEETTPLVMFMKKIYQDARGFDEADPNNPNEGDD
ncbi:hypothetical protein MNBD_CHLOROFLEXI01-249 [hydrothermal vent metagenome]|uniref:Uncharacterized protein n=1 Tax=hydrothermal vent metagenome TaxID=652676 RepID=A0A3B0V803_9ZZZZ